MVLQAKLLEVVRDARIPSLRYALWISWGKLQGKYTGNLNESEQAMWDCAEMATRLVTNAAFQFENIEPPKAVICEPDNEFIDTFYKRMMVFTDAFAFEEKSQRLTKYLMINFPKNRRKKKIDQFIVESILMSENVNLELSNATEPTSNREIITYHRLAKFLSNVEEPDSSMNIRIKADEKEVQALKE